MNVVLYYRDNGFGLTQDAKVVDLILKKLGGFNVIHKDPQAPVQSDISIHFEIPATKGIELSYKAIFFPNFEWFFFDTSVLRRFDVVACKTHSAVPIAKQYTDHVVYTGFMSEDMLSQKLPRKLEVYHIGGQSRLKNTETILNCWREYPELPTLHLFTHVYQAVDLPENIRYHFGPVDRQIIKATMNNNLIALQPSATEGYGQVLWEALSTGSILVTTNAPPMDEIPAPYKLPAKRTGTHNRQITWGIEPEDIANTIMWIYGRQYHKLVEMSIQARENWLQNANAFISRFVGLL